MSVNANEIQLLKAYDSVLYLSSLCSNLSMPGDEFYREKSEAERCAPAG